MKPLRWPTTSQESAYLNMRQNQNRVMSRTNPNENWLADKLKEAGLRFKRQRRWGYRIFDFWSAHLGIAVESDGPEHDKDYDGYRDEYNYRRSGIIVLRVRNRNEEDTAKVIEKIKKARTWKQRREAMGLHATSQQERRKWVTDSDHPAPLDRFPHIERPYCALCRARRRLEPGTTLCQRCGRIVREAAKVRFTMDPANPNYTLNRFKKGAKRARKAARRH